MQKLFLVGDVKSHVTVSLRLKGKGGDWNLLGLLNAKAVP
jgi:hypothetical protein